MIARALPEYAVGDVLHLIDRVLCNVARYEVTEVHEPAKNQFVYVVCNEYGSFEYTLNASDLKRRVVQRVKR